MYITFLVIQLLYINVISHNNNNSGSVSCAVNMYALKKF